VNEQLLCKGIKRWNNAQALEKINLGRDQSSEVKSLDESEAVPAIFVINTSGFVYLLYAIGFFISLRHYNTTIRSIYSPPPQYRPKPRSNKSFQS